MPSAFDALRQSATARSAPSSGMLVPLTAEEGSSRPWALLEMQGELERKDGGSLEEAFDVGTLSVSSSVSRGRRARGGKCSGSSSCSQPNPVLH